MGLFNETLKRCLIEAGICYDRGQIEQCEKYYRLMIDANKHINLTRITDEEQAADMHFANAAYLLGFLDLPTGCRVIDIGTGAGFPGIPLKLLRPDINITLLDSAHKKTDFVRHAAERMHIDVTVLIARAEEAARTILRETFDAAVSRAVAPLSILLELCIPYLRCGGVFAAWKGESFMQELDAANTALNALFCKVRSFHRIGPGAIILIEKQKPTPEKYPRRYAKIKSAPL
ncbi:MAG: 16S rRNA (guanine(527)-N(7))-methyltransferase RsmG [Christensenellales bacterium]|jgi:16S rRNA (guanine527-N7)-methyltransferase